jgi:hypothetical protein
VFSILSTAYASVAKVYSRFSGGIMKILTTGFVLVFLLVAGCAKNGIDATQIVNGTRPGTLTPKTASQVAYRYAFSAQVTSESTGEVIKNFSVELAASDSSVGAVVNALGNENGIFHISRQGSDKASTTLPVLISAPGFQPAVQLLNVASDCSATDCSGAKPLAIALAPLLKLIDAKNTAPFDPSKIQNLIATNGVPALFQNLVNQGKLDLGTSSVLSGAKNGEVLQNILVMLNGTSGTQTGNLVSDLLSNIPNDKIQNLAGLGGVIGTIATLAPLLANSNPQVAVALVAVNALLPYLTPILSNVAAGKSGPLGQVIASFLQNGNAQTNIMNLIAALQGAKPGANGASLAMATILPIVQDFISKAAAANGANKPYLNILNQALQNPNLMTLITSLGQKNNGSKAIALFATYLGPLIQGLAGKDSAQIAALFNELTKANGVLSLKNFGKDPAQLAQFAALVPYLEPIVRGLNSTDAQALAKILIPLLNTKDPSQAIGTLVSGLIKNDPNGASQLLTTLFPNLGSLAKQAVPGKQMLSAQILQGLINGDFKNLHVVQDLPGTSGVVLSGTARDIFKLAQLPNVEKVVALGTAVAK